VLSRGRLLVVTPRLSESSAFFFDRVVSRLSSSPFSFLVFFFLLLLRESFDSPSAELFPLQGVPILRARVTPFRFVECLSNWH